MKTGLDKYISNQVQDIEDNLQVGNWDVFKKHYAEHRRRKALRRIAPVVLAASIAIAVALLGKGSVHSEPHIYKDIDLIADNPTIIHPAISVCKKKLTEFHKPCKEVVSDTIIESERYRRDTMSVKETDRTDSIPPVKKETSLYGKPHNDYDTYNISTRLSKKSASTFSVGLSGRPGMLIRTKSVVQFNGPGNGMFGGGMEEVSYKHLPPMTLGFSLGVNLSKRITLITGLDYSLYISHKEIKSSDNVRHEMQKLHYLGLPLRCSYTIYSNKSFEWYAGGGFEVEKCIAATPETASLKERNFLWSAVATMGIQYNITSCLSLYCEPYCSYLLSEAQLFSYRSDNPIGISASIGVRVNIKTTRP